MLLLLATRHEPLNPVFILLTIYSCAFKIELSEGLDSGLHSLGAVGHFYVNWNSHVSSALKGLRPRIIFDDWTHIRK